MITLLLCLQSDRLHVSVMGDHSLHETSFRDASGVLAHLHQFDQNEFSVHRKPSHAWESILPIIVHDIFARCKEQLSIDYFNFPPYFDEDLRIDFGMHAQPLALSH